MAKIVIQHEVDPAIGIVLEYVAPETGRVQGWHGVCTECGRVIHRWAQDKAVQDSQVHVDSHQPQRVGVDPSSVVGRD